jgi:S-formylglutathione hydrolase
LILTLALRKKHKTFGGETAYYTHDSEAIGLPMNFSVYVPEGPTLTSFPVLYFLSGLTCTEENFMVKAGAQQFAARHGLMLVACDTSPRGLDIPGVRESWDFGEGAGFYVNATRSPWDRHFRMYDYVTDELPALVEKQLPAVSGLRSIMGHSMGGHGALVIALRNSSRYRSVSAFAPIVSPTRCPWGEKALGRYLGEDRQDWDAYDATRLVRQQSGSRRLPMLVDQGGADEFLARQLKPDLLVAACREADYPLQYRLHEGYDHSYYFISTFIGDHIAFHARHLA